MKLYFLQLFIMVLGTMFVLFGIGVRAASNHGKEFSFPKLFSENANRLALAAFGLIVVSLGFFLDPLGVEEAVQQLPIVIQLGSPFITGAGIGGLCLLLSKN